MASMSLSRGLMMALLAASLFAMAQCQCPFSGVVADQWTTNSGQPVYNNDDSLTVGLRGPVLLEDYHLLEKLAHLNRERIPERLVHATGTTAKGFFEVTKDVSNFTFADFLSEPGKKTDVIVRFSTGVPSRGGAETVRDPRGFAVKFYTNEGNYDLVGNNMPVFFIRDAMKFADMVHAFKPNPVTNLPNNWRMVDFFSHLPESVHMFTHVFDDIGIPKDYRHMNGFGVHTFKWINSEGKERLVKYHWKSSQGVESLLDEEAQAIGGKDQKHMTRDLLTSIANGDFPEWVLHVQLMDPSTAASLDFDPLDVTKTWPEDRFPLVEVGRMVLDKNINNFFNENEQVAFSPALVVPGITYSEDKLLQGRIFAYTDTQRYRVGPNYLSLPVNAPKSGVLNNQMVDGVLNFVNKPNEEVNYFPSKISGAQLAERYPISGESICGKRTQQVIKKESNFGQAGELYRSWDADRQERFAERISKEMLLQPGVTEVLQKIWMHYWSEVDVGLGNKLKTKMEDAGVLL
ncbi:unnamed protein product [Ostreobium quekettii]|uniref:catalase n=1 Tax=Ostreobium quekettii TaxID=121088 RepID=A0A8S1IS42_9CHLO|nr:unnamed protein product [Ostreobium quekettii]|eukprot:evm.model.scf_43EXC.3 EVM.evm.TU.scf_43EXC.3   scf_43EXC:24658-29237(-)